MGLFDPTTPTPPTPPQLVEMAFRQSVNQAKQLLAQHAQFLTNSWKLVWQNPQKLSPQQVCDVIQTVATAAGSSCAQVFAAHAAGVAYVNGMIPGAVKAPYDAVPAGVTITANEDGSLTVTMPTH